MTQTIVNLGTGGSDLNGQNGSTTSADSNDAQYLDWPGGNGGNYVYLPGVTGNILQVPHAANLAITGDLDLRARVAFPTFPPASNQSVIYKWFSDGVNERSYGMFVNATTGTLALTWSVDGAPGVTRTSTVAPTMTADAPLWLRATLDVDNGAAGHDVKFYTSTDGTTWTQLGTTVTTAGVTSIFANTRAVSIGSFQYNGGGNMMTAKVYNAQIYSGIAGTKVLDVDTSMVASGSATSFGAVTGQTVTILRSSAGRKSVAVTSPVWLFGTDDYFRVAHNGLLNSTINQSMTYLMVVRTWATPVSAGGFASKITAGASGVGFNLESNSTNHQSAAYVSDGPTGLYRAGGTYTQGALSVIGFILDRDADQLRIVADGTIKASSSSSAVGSIANSEPFYVGTRSAATVFQDFECVATIVLRRAATASELSAIQTYYTSRVA